MKCEPSYINNSQHLIKTFVGASLLMAANRELGCFNVHVVNELQFAVGLALKPLGACIVNRATYLDDDNYTLPHEIGHLVGLIHTHIFWDWQIKCFKESVSRTRTWPTFNLCISNRIISKRVCESTGDGLSDTQADPRLLSNFSCNYTGGGSDLWGDSYANPPNGPQESPNTHNVMSYQGLDGCVDQFSRLQIGVMLYNLYIFNSANGAVWRNPIHTFDDFEPDNNQEMTNPIALKNRNISINEIQERNFHQQYNTLPGVPVPVITQCDVDWVRFVAPCSRNFDILTSAMAGRTNANTRLTLFSSALVQLAQNDNISATNLFSRINWAFVAGQEYFIRIENMSANVTGYYALEIGNPFTTAMAITGNNSVCPSGSYGVTGLPAGSTVSWSASPLNLVSFSCNPCSPTTINRVADGTVTITATISVNICGTVFTQQVSRQIISGSPPISISSSTNGCNGVYQQWNLVNNTPNNGSNWNWSVNYLSTNSEIIIYNPSSPSTMLSVKGGGTVRLTYTNLCGVVTTDGVTVYSTCSGFRMIVSPNPAQNKINLSLNPVDNNNTISNASTSSAPLKTVESKGKTIVSLFEVNTKRLVKQWTYNEFQSLNYNLNITGFKKGVYVLQVDRDNQTNVTKIIIE